jgi:His/Glu/Gln/Arg/opine family amino acid ABC transporter permease subunit
MTPNDFLQLVQGAAVSLALALGSILCGTILAIGLTALAFVPMGLIRALYRWYIWAIRGTPMLVLAMLVFYSLGSALELGPYSAAVVVLSIYLSALVAEIFRGGVLAIPRSLWDSAHSLGLPRSAMLRLVVAPLVLRYSLPPYLNACVMAVKASSVLSIIGVWELTYASREIIERTLDVFSVLSVAAILYFVMCLAVDRVGRRIERHLAAKGFAGERI